MAFHRQRAQVVKRQRQVGMRLLYAFANAIIWLRTNATRYSDSAGALTQTESVTRWS